ncbi:Hypothetical protein TFLO_1602 [Trichococcus flocculiformis]|uniref:Uncharacterized protein n=1 Tax=Trichococcus flocculiformis TaxID=82803 RepID=A0AB38BL21_9LACT|nr:Hypothetical protein TFLO_1602 [Trichococcus flocculiformis]SFI13630.1 hypothetical protein SAMN04488507_105710 [Trichococcus flocculiformis]
MFKRTKKTKTNSTRMLLAFAFFREVNEFPVVIRFPSLTIAL